jgi:hypothetical protein
MSLKITMLKKMMVEQMALGKMSRHRRNYPRIERRINQSINQSSSLKRLGFGATEPEKSTSKLERFTTRKMYFHSLKNCLT